MRLNCGEIVLMINENTSEFKPGKLIYDDFGKIPYLIERDPSKFYIPISNLITNKNRMIFRFSPYETCIWKGGKYVISAKFKRELLKYEEET